MARLDSFFQKMIELGASDLHLTTGVRPYFRLDGEIVPLEEDEIWTDDVMTEVLAEIAPERNWAQFQKENDTDFAYEIPGLARFRSNYFMDRLGPGAVFRQIPEEILTADQLNLPQCVRDLCYLTKGLVLVTGPTGSGKSTTLAAMIDLINKSRNDHIITIEDPVEFVHKTQKCLVRQREVGQHTESFKRALRAALREDPDIILVGELRDLETIEIAIETAETGHLVFGTLHTTTAASTVDRIIDQFPADRQAQIRTMLSGSLKGVIAQTLCKKQPKGRVAALEIMLGTQAVSALIREGKTHQITSQMQMGAKNGMRLLNDSLVKHVKDGLVSPEEAYMKSVNKDELKAKLGHIGMQVDMAKLAKKHEASEAPPKEQRPATPEAEEPVTSASSDVEEPQAALPPEPKPQAASSFDDFESFRKNRR